MGRKKLVYTEQVFDYETEEDRRKHIRIMRMKHYSLKDISENNNDKMKFTAVFSR